MNNITHLEIKEFDVSERNDHMKWEWVSLNEILQSMMITMY